MKSGRHTLNYIITLSFKRRSDTRDFIFMFWIIANECACLMIYLFWEYLVNKLNYGILHQLPAISNPNSKHFKDPASGLPAEMDNLQVKLQKLNIYLSNLKLYLPCLCSNISLIDSSRDLSSFSNSETCCFDWSSSSSSEIINCWKPCNFDQKLFFINVIRVLTIRQWDNTLNV